MHSDPAAAITEFRELVALAPDSPMCHGCLATAFYNIGRYPEAEKEFQIAMETDPADATSHRGLGLIRESEKNYDAHSPSTAKPKLWITRRVLLLATQGASWC